MRPLFLILLLAAIIPGRDACGDDVYVLISKGYLDQARDSLSRMATASSRDGNTLFYQSLLEPSADQAARLMETALRTSVSVRYQEEIYFRLAQYYLLKKDYQQLSSVLMNYQSRWETGKYHAQMLRLSVLLDELVKDFDSALRQCDRYLVSYSSNDAHQWGQIDKARILSSNKKGIGSSKMLKQLLRAKSGAGIPQALYQLGMEAARKNRADDAVFYYSLLREGYPAAVGLDDLVEKLGGMSAGTVSGSTAEELTGTYYSVKVGVFSSSSNARRQANKFKKYKHEAEIKSKTISGKKYHVVYVGKFQDYQQAVTFKIQLEATCDEAFQVVAR